MKPLIVKARLRNGIARKDPWSPSIDGILAAAFMRERLGYEQYVVSGASVSHLDPVVGLPLETVTHGDTWWYAASSPEILHPSGKERRYFHRRFDDQHEKYLAGQPKKIMTAAGPYKNTRLWRTRTICRGIQWHVIGDTAEITRLLRSILQIGGGRAAGYGEVAEWIVEHGGAPERARYHRPLPASFAADEGIAGPVMPWGLVPPGRVSPVDCVMPEIADAG